MPSRVIRGEINSSESLSRVSIGAELTFRALLNTVDDYGRFDARPEMLKAALFPVRADVTPHRVMEWIRELQNEGCVHLYEVDGRPCLAMSAWEKHFSKQRRATKSRYPDPPVGAETHRNTIPGNTGKSPEIPAGVGVGDGLKETSDGLDASASPPPVGKSKSREPWALKAADLLGSLLKPVPGARLPAGWRNRWAKEIEAMPREIPELGALSPDECAARIECLIRWALGPDNLGQEYEVVIRSGASLREKYPKLVAGSRRKARAVPARPLPKIYKAEGKRSQKLSDGEFSELHDELAVIRKQSGLGRKLAPR